MAAMAGAGRDAPRLATGRGRPLEADQRPVRDRPDHGVVPVVGCAREDRHATQWRGRAAVHRTERTLLSEIAKITSNCWMVGALLVRREQLHLATARRRENDLLQNSSAQSLSLSDSGRLSS